MSQREGRGRLDCKCGRVGQRSDGAGEQTLEVRGEHAGRSEFGSGAQPGLEDSR